MLKTLGQVIAGVAAKDLDARLTWLKSDAPAIKMIIQGNRQITTRIVARRSVSDAQNTTWNNLCEEISVVDAQIKGHEDPLIIRWNDTAIISKDTNGYLNISICKNYQYYICAAEQVIAETFEELRPDLSPFSAHPLPSDIYFWIVKDFVSEIKPKKVRFNTNWSRYFSELDEYLKIPTRENIIRSMRERDVEIS